MRRIVVLYMFILLFLVQCGPSLSAQADSVVVQNVTVIDSTGSVPMQHVSVLILGDRIKSITPAAKAVPRGPARV